MPVVLYSRRGCHLCEQVEEWLAFHAPESVVIDVDDETEPASAYGLRVPVVEIEGAVVLEGRFEEAELVAAIRRGSVHGDGERR